MCVMNLLEVLRMSHAPLLFSFRSLFEWQDTELNNNVSSWLKFDTVVEPLYTPRHNEKLRVLQGTESERRKSLQHRAFQIIRLACQERY